MASRSRISSVMVATAWGGALLFVVSLSYFLYSYLVRFGGTAAQGTAAAPALVDTMLFSGFALHHSLFARTAIKTRVRQAIPPPLERALYTWIASALFLAVCWWWQPVPGLLYRIPSPLSWIGVVLQIAGIVLTILGSRAIDVLDLAGVRPVLRAQRGEPDRHTPLIMTGVHALVRHPLYLGWTLLVFGAPVMTATRAVFALLSCTYLALAIPWEERALAETFGSQYEAYRAKVRWRMMPGLY